MESPETETALELWLFPALEPGVEAKAGLVHIALPATPAPVPLTT
jgi:hypothetical protein